MKKVITIITTMVIAMSKLISQTTLTAEESNPNKMGWMQGFPPPKDRIISAADGSFFDFPALRYSVNHMREFFPTRNVPSAKKDYYSFKEKIDNNIDQVAFIPWNDTNPMTWKES